MPTLREYASRLDRIDWNFPQAGTAVGSIHRAHWFAGNFISQIPAALIEVLSEQNDLVLDPFGGSGTTTIEAARLGRRGVYSDIVSACYFIAIRKIAAATTQLTQHTRTSIMLALTWDHACTSDQVGERGEGANPELTYWYSAVTLAQLRFIWKLLEGFGGADRLILELAFSDLLFSCASTSGSQTSTGRLRRHHWGWVADNVVPKTLVHHNAIEGFRARIHALPTPFETVHRPTLLQGAAQKLQLPSGSVDLIITSPPYIGVIDYVKANRLLYLWMNWSFDAERASEIGARYKRRRPSLVEDYILDMSDCWSEFHRVLRVGGKLGVVIGESRAFPGTVDRTIADLASIMPIIWGPRERVPTRRRVSERGARDAREMVLVAGKL